MNILFRADANSNIGQGHVMRMLSLADAFLSVPVTSFSMGTLSASAIFNAKSAEGQLFRAIPFEI